MAAIRVVPFVSLGTTGNQTIQAPGFGIPNAAVFIGSLHQPVADSTVNAAMSIGFTDGTNHAVVATRSDSGQLAADTKRRGATNQVILIQDGSTTVANEASFVSFGIDTITINWDLMNQPDRQMCVWFIRAPDAKVGTWTQGTGNGTEEDQDIGFLPTTVFCATNGVALDDTNQLDAMLSWGIAINQDGTITQRCIVGNSDDNADPTTCAGRISETRLGINHRFNSASISRAIELTAFNDGSGAEPAGFTTTTRDQLDASTNDYAYLALNLGGLRQTLASIDSGPTSATDVRRTENWPGFRPNFCTIAGGEHTAYDTGSVAFGMNLMIGCFDDERSAWSVVFNEEDNSTESNSSTQSRLLPLFWARSDETDETRAQILEFNGTGYTFEWPQIDTTAKAWFGYALEEDREVFMVRPRRYAMPDISMATNKNEDAQFLVGGTNTGNAIDDGQPNWFIDHDQITLAAWAKVDSRQPDDHRWICYADSADAPSTGWLLGFSDNGTVANAHLRINGTLDVDDLFGSTDLDGRFGEWIHYAGKYDRTNGMEIFVDGVSDGTLAGDNGDLEAIVDARVLFFQTDITGTENRNPDGAVAHPAMWREALTDFEILQLARGVNPGQIQPHNLVFYYPLNTGWGIGRNLANNRHPGIIKPGSGSAGRHPLNVGAFVAAQPLTRVPQGPNAPLMRPREDLLPWQFIGVKANPPADVKTMFTLPYAVPVGS